MAKDKPSAIERYSDRQWRFQQFLQANNLAVLSTVTPNGDPHGVVIYYVANPDFTVDFLTRSETRKRDNLRFNTHIMLTIYNPAGETVLQISGIAHEVTAGYDVNEIAGRILRASLKSQPIGLPPIAKLDAGPYIGFHVVPSRMHMAMFSRPDGGEDSDIFDSMESFDLEA